MIIQYNIGALFTRKKRIEKSVGYENVIHVQKRRRRSAREIVHRGGWKREAGNAVYERERQGEAVATHYGGRTKLRE